MAWADTKISVLSGGEKRRVALVRLLLQKPDLGPLTEQQKRAVRSMEQCTERLRIAIDNLVARIVSQMEVHW